MRARWLARILLRVLQRRIATRPPDVSIRRNANDPTVYLRRWWVIPRDEKRWFNLYLHNMLIDDETVLHDHPYWSLSLVLTDGLVELYNEEPFELDVGPSKMRVLQQGDIVWRSSRFAHQLCILRGRDPWTLFLTGPRVREWGFWCPSGWRSWRTYGAQNSAVKDGAPTRLGCGEEVSRDIRQRAVSALQREGRQEGG